MNILSTKLSSLLQLSFPKFLFGKQVSLLPFFKSSNLPIFQSSKKVLAVFIAFVMFFNGFVPKSAEVKNNFIMALTCVVHSAMFEVFSQCTEAVTTMSNKLAHELIELITAETGSTKPVDNKKSDE